jgi:hypothetical protein
MRLLTDHPQWYDAIFNDQPPVFHRLAFTRGGLAKRQQFQLFDTLGLPTPMHGTVTELAARLQTPRAGCLPPQAVRDSFRLVVYVDEYSHRGQGKVRLPLAQALREFPGCFASVFHSQPAAATAIRLVRLGRLAFWLEQTAGGPDWRSNQNDRETVLSRHPAAEPNPVPRVLWAIDFIRGAEGLLAVDFNTAPELSTLGETGALTAADIQRELDHAAAETPSHLQQF